MKYDLKSVLFILFVSLCLLSCSKSRMAIKGELADALELLDEAIDEFPDRLQETFDEIDRICSDLASATDDRKRMECCEKLSDEYINVSVDSVSIYAERMLGYAKALSDPDGVATALMYLCSVAQMKEDYLGAINRLNSISLVGVSEETIKQYHARAESVFYSLFIRSFNSPNYRYLNHPKEYYRQKLNENRTAYLSLDSTSSKAAMIRISELRDDKRYPEALALLEASKDQMFADELQKVWYRYHSVLDAFVEDTDSQMVNLVMASVYDLRLPTRDNLSLIGLSRFLSKNGYVERASKYISFASKNSFKLKTAARMSYAESTSNKILSALSEKQKQTRHWLAVSVVILCVLLLGLFLAFLYSQRLRANLAYNLSRLKEADLIKNNYLFRYMVLSANYLDSADDYHKELRRMVRKGEMDELYRILKSPSRFEGDKRSFYDIFDETFLKMFPHFIERVNFLMKPDHLYALTKSGHLPVEVRVLAVMRMGMTDSNQIAQFMSYSIATVYTYRSRSAEKSLYSREDFERKVLDLPLD